MGMITQYVRLTGDELSQLRESAAADSGQAWEFLGALAEGSAGDVPESQLRALDVDKAWDAIRFLLHRAGPPPVDVISGGTPLLADSEDDLRVLSATEVLDAARFLGATPLTALAKVYDRAAMKSAGLYPGIWDDDDALDYVGQWYGSLVEFLAGAARDGDALAIWLS